MWRVMAKLRLPTQVFLPLSILVSLPQVLGAALPTTTLPAPAATATPAPAQTPSPSSNIETAIGGIVGWADSMRARARLRIGFGPPT